MTNVWITRPYDLRGIQEVELIEAGENFLRYKAPGTINYDSEVEEGVYWHRTKEDAITGARRLRAEWIVKTKQEADRVAALPFPFEP